MILFFIILGYLVCGFLAWGFTLAKFTRLFPWQDHRGIATGTAMAGPLGLVVSLLESRPPGFRLRPYSYEHRCGIFAKNFPLLWKRGTRP